MPGEQFSDAGRSARKNGRSCAVLLIDVQNAYFEAPPLRPLREGMIMACNRLTALAARHGQRVLLVGTRHERDKSTWTRNMLEDDQGFAFRGSSQAAWLDGLDTADLPVLWKTRDSAFFGTDLYLRLKNWSVDSLVLAGVESENCVALTASDAFAHNFDVAISRDAIATADPGAADAALSWLESSYRQSVLDWNGIEDWLRPNERVGGS